MKFKVTIKKNGEKVTEVIDRQEGEQCGKVKTFTNALGPEVSDEITGPECDSVQEFNV